MDMIQLMMDEHQNILKMLQVVRSAMVRFMEEDQVCENDVSDMFDFVKHYADAHHHGKEEIFLFDDMIKEIGPVANKLITHGMLVEHDFGRMYVMNTLEALKAYLVGQKDKKIDIITNAMAYCELLKRHIDKEDRVVFALAKRELNEDVLNTMNEKALVFESEHQERKDKYISILNRLEKKYQVNLS
jgi:hemerythrin-like domain-containing protein